MRTGVFTAIIALLCFSWFSCSSDDDDQTSADDDQVDDDTSPSNDDDDDNDDDASPAGDDDDDNDNDDDNDDTEPPSPYLHTAGSWMMDGRNRVVILRGPEVINTGPPYISYHLEEDYDRLVEWGFNSIRLGTDWAAIEPEPGVYDEEYLALLDERIGWCRERGIQAVLEMHQDLYSGKYSGNGAPAWACLDHDIPYTPLSPWFVNYLQPAVFTAFNSFWKNEEGIQDHFIAMWTHLAERYAEETGLAGFDLFNEPYFGTFLPLLRFDRQCLQPFYRKLITAMQTADANHLYFFEPAGAVGAGLPFHMGPMNLPNAVYAPHAYSALANVFHVYYGNVLSIAWIVKGAAREAKQMEVPFWMGEWALFEAETLNAEQYMLDITRLLDEEMASWGYWIYNKDDNVGLLDLDGNEREWVLNAVSRTYPQRICGYPESFGFDPETSHFAMNWKENPEASGPTVIYIPQPRHYPDGFTVQCSDDEGAWSYEWDEERYLLSVWADRTTASHTLTIDPQ